MQLGQLLSQASLVLQRERGARLVRSRAGRHGREILRGGIRRCSVASRRRELESASLALERDDRTGGRKRRRQAGHEPARHLRGQRCAAERVRELAALSREAAALLGFPPRTQQQPPDEAEHGRSGRREQCQREHQPVPGRREHIRAGAVDRNRPARNLRRREDHEMIAALVQSAHAREEADLILQELPLQRGVAWTGEAREQLSPAPVQHDEAGEAEVGRAALHAESVDEQRSGEHAGHVPLRVARRHRHHEDAPMRTAGGDALAHERRARRHHRLEVGAIGEVEGRARLRAARSLREAAAVDPSEAPRERPSHRRLHPLEVLAHCDAISRLHRRRPGDGLQRCELSAEIRVDDRARQDHASASVVDGGPARLVVLMPGKPAGGAYEQQPRQQDREQQARPQREAAAEGILEHGRRLGRSGRPAWVDHAFTGRPCAPTSSLSPRRPGR